jgi:hypothetical protein
VRPGIDLPAWFCSDIESLDEEFHLVFHPYRVLWDDIMNEYAGAYDDGKFTIHKEHGHEIWGFTLTDGTGKPIEEGAWHLWRQYHPHGFAHVVKIESKNPEYLMLLLNRLWLQARYVDKYGQRAWAKALADEQEELNEKQRKDKEDTFGAIQDENSWLMKRVMENMDRGHTKPTNPQHESIISYPGQVNRTRIVRPLEDDDPSAPGHSRIITPNDW